MTDTHTHTPTQTIVQLFSIVKHIHPQLTIDPIHLHTLYSLLNIHYPVEFVFLQYRNRIDTFVYALFFQYVDHSIPNPPLNHSSLNTKCTHDPSDILIAIMLIAHVREIYVTHDELGMCSICV